MHSHRHYTVPYSCSNCGRRVSKAFDRGREAPQVVDCTYCGCPTARKDTGDWDRKDVRPYTVSLSPIPERPKWPMRGRIL